VTHNGPFFTIPPSEIGPKPVQRPHPPLLFGMFSEAGYRRTVRYADGWTSSGLSVRRTRATVDKLNAQRSADQAPLSVHHRIYLRSPVPEVAELTTIDEVVAEVIACREAGFDEVIIELNFWERVDSEAAWADAPSWLSPVLHAAH
ncbi:MAG: LLM class flavin-dependent oxidoreductase, partial [Ilumatobacteraceae bacterium]